jgi:hypothetical protein
VKRALVVGAVVGGMAIVVIIVESLGTVIYPGSLRWTAPVLCPADQPDSYVVRTTVQDSEGTSTSFSLFCMGERGDFSEAGSWRPLGVLFLYLYLSLMALNAAFLALYRRRRRRDEPIVTPRPLTPL